jgi:tRNA(adenine34) deaminase
MNISLDHKDMMKQALLEARKAEKKGEVPVGAVVVEDNKVIARAHNQTITAKDPTAHAEILALREACRIKNNHRIPECDLYVTLEPCVMCLGAVVQARIRRLVFGGHDPKSGAVESMMVFPFDKTNHIVKIKSGILAEECGKILKDFFKERR